MKSRGEKQAASAGSALAMACAQGEDTNLIRRSPLEQVYRRAHCMYATGPCTTVSSWLMDTANALSGSTCRIVIHITSASGKKCHSRQNKEVVTML